MGKFDRKYLVEFYLSNCVYGTETFDTLEQCEIFIIELHKNQSVEKYAFIEKINGTYSKLIKKGEE